MRAIFLLTFCLILTSTKAQDDNLIIGADPCEQASFPNLQGYIQNYLIKNGYPDSNYQGTVKVFVGFEVDTLGKVSNVNVKRSAGPKFDKAATELVKNMPDWRPCVCNSKPEKCRMILPVIFKLQ